jgi:protein O-GlcNAc transferase
MTDPKLHPPSLSPTLGDICSKAIEYHHAGQLEAAETVYRAVLQVDPRHPLANYQLGLLIFQLQQPEVALSYLLVALEADPETAEHWLVYAEALMQAGQRDQAREVLALGGAHGLAGQAFDALLVLLDRSELDKPVSRSLPAKKSLSKGVRPTAAEEAVLVKLLDQGGFSEGVPLAITMTERFPLHGFGWKVLGALLRSQGKSAAALRPSQRSVQLLPRDAQARTNLGLILGDLGRLVEAAACHRRAIGINPRFADAYNNLGTTLKLQGQLDEAEACYRKALALNGNFAEANNNLGVMLYEQKQFAEAEAAYLGALAIQPNYPEACNNLGNVLRKQGRLAEAETFLRRALVSRPGYAEAYYNLASTLREQGRPSEAVASFRQALTLKPDFFEAQLNLALTVSEQGQLKEAERIYQELLAVSPKYVEAYNNLGGVLRQQGHLQAAEASYRRGLNLKPNDAEMFSNLLFNHCCGSSTSVSYYLGEARQYGALLERITGARFSSWISAPTPSRLRVGLVSGDLRNHAVGHWLECLVTHIDPARIELIAYPTSSDFDDLSARVAPFFSAWKPLSDHSNEDAARMIHADGIHVLIDASGHTAGNRLPVFAWKPAPVQVSWLGYFATTGVAEIDYLLGDSFVTPSNEAAHFTETIWRLPESYLCFTPPKLAMEVGPLPALVNGYVTFGCFNNLAKMGDEVVAVWARVLHAVPNSRLFLKTRQLNDVDLYSLTCQRFADFGIAADRLIMEGGAPRAALLAAYQRVDIALDPFPYPGGTTSVEAIWMGVPLITRCGDRFLSHMGETIDHNVGLTDWIASDNDDYVAKAVSFSGDLAQLAITRAKLRQQALDSPLFNAPRFARNFEVALWGMWQKWATEHEVSK